MCGRRELYLEHSWNVGLCQDERLPRNLYDPFARPASDRWRQVAHRFVYDVDTDDGKIPVLKFKNVRTTVKRDCRRAVLAQDPNQRVWRPRSIFFRLFNIIY